ncbi:MAG: signal recognition particle protein [Alphaproteobacteria bacterium]
MFESLASRLGDVFGRLRKRGTLSAEDVQAALREIRIALLEADVALPVVKDFLAKVEAEATGEAITRAVAPGQMVVKIVHDALVDMLGQEASPLALDGQPPVSILFVGLQGSGKTTTVAKIGRRLAEQEGKKVLMASLDVVRPAAQEQLAILGKQTGIAVLPIVAGETPVTITKRALAQAADEGFDVVLLDTAGRLHVDDDMMAEAEAVRDTAKPAETLLVADAMTGQDALNVAETFTKRIGLTGIVLTRLDGDARGGAALSMRAVTGCPIKFVGVGEKLDALDRFYPERIAGRILGMGDVVTLVEKAQASANEQDIERLTKKLEKGRFDLEDMAQQFRQLRKMGGIGELVSLLPGLNKMQKDLAASKVDEKLIQKQEAIISSMTPKERRNPQILHASRKQRIAAGSGTSVRDINRLLKQFRDMQTMMKKMKKLEKLGQGKPGLGLPPFNPMHPRNS